MTEPVLEMRLEQGDGSRATTLVRLGPREQGDIGVLIDEALAAAQAGSASDAGWDRGPLRLVCTGRFVEHTLGLVRDADAVARLARLRCSLDIQLTRDMDAFVRHMRSTQPDEDITKYVAPPGASPEGVVYLTVQAVGLDREAVSERLGLEADEFWPARMRLTVGDRRRYGTWVLSSGFLPLDDFSAPLDEMLERIEPHATTLVGLVELGLPASVDFVAGHRTPVVPRLILDGPRLARIAALRAGIWLDIEG